MYVSVRCVHHKPQLPVYALLRLRRQEKQLYSSPFSLSFLALQDRKEIVMNQKITKLVVLTVVTGIVLVIAAVAANAQSVCVMHPAGDMVPCGHVVMTPYGPRQLHAFDVIPCTHFIPCY